jgi:hypothetical protein
MIGIAVQVKIRIRKQKGRNRLGRDFAGVLRRTDRALNVVRAGREQQIGEDVDICQYERTASAVSIQSKKILAARNGEGALGLN